MISAKEARGLYNDNLPKLEKAIREKFQEGIKQSAVHNKREYRFFVCSSFKTFPDFHNLQEKVVNDLRQLGYTVSYIIFNYSPMDRTPRSSISSSEDEDYEIVVQW